MMKWAGIYIKCCTNILNTVCFHAQSSKTGPKTKQSKTNAGARRASLFVCSFNWEGGGDQTTAIWKETRPISVSICCPLVKSAAVSRGNYKEFFSPKTNSTNMTSNSNLSNMRRLVEQLKLEASVERIKVTETNRGEKKQRRNIVMSLQVRQQLIWFERTWKCLQSQYLIQNVYKWKSLNYTVFTL